MFVLQEAFSENESEIIVRLLGPKIRELSGEVVRFEGKKMLLIISNIKKFLIMPK